MSSPIISFNVVIKGPDAIAGSSFNLLINNGTVDPITVETLNVQRIETPTIKASTQFPSYITEMINVMEIIQIKPSIKPALNSRLIIRQKPPFSRLPSASPRTATARDWVPTLPAESIIIGIKAAKSTTASNVSSNWPMTFAVIKPKNMRATIQGARFLAVTNPLKFISVAPFVAEISPKSSVASSSKISIISSTVTIPSRWFCLDTTGAAKKSYFLISRPTSSWSISSGTDTTRVLIMSSISAVGDAMIKSRREATPTSLRSLSTTYK